MKGSGTIEGRDREKTKEAGVYGDIADGQADEAQQHKGHEHEQNLVGEGSRLDAAQVEQGDTAGEQQTPRSGNGSHR